MNVAMFIAAFASRRLFTETFTSNTTWIAPVDVHVLASVVGRGQSGTVDSVATASPVLSINVTYSVSGHGPGSGSVTWADIQSAHDGNFAAMNAGGTVGVNQVDLIMYGDGSNDIDGSATATYLNVVPGTAVSVYNGGWSSSGSISSSGYSQLRYDYTIPGAAGADTTGFGFTFSGGAANTAATPVTHNNVAITAGGSYPLVIPAGGSITITYYR